MIQSGKLQTKKTTARVGFSYMARVEGFEPPTAWFVARYSIQLSYTRAKLLLVATSNLNNGGEGGIRTLDTSNRYGSLAGNWFQPLTHLSVTWGCILRIHLMVSILFSKKNAYPVTI